MEKYKVRESKVFARAQHQNEWNSLKCLRDKKEQAKLEAAFKINIFYYRDFKNQNSDKFFLTGS